MMHCLAWSCNNKNRLCSKTCGLKWTFVSKKMFEYCIFSYFGEVPGGILGVPEGIPVSSGGVPVGSRGVPVSFGGVPVS